MERSDLEVVGVRREGLCTGYVKRRDVEAERATDTRPFAPVQVISGDGSLSEVIHILTRYDFCFVTAMGGGGRSIGRPGGPDPARRQLRACPGRVGVPGTSQCHTHAALDETFRLAEKAKIRAGYGQNLIDPLEDDALGIQAAVDDGTGAGIA